MGKKGTLQRSQQRQVRHTRENRERKSIVAKAVRRGDFAATTERLVKRTTPQRAAVSEEKKALLIAQFAQACRLPAACDDLCSLLLCETSAGEEQAGVSRKRPRDDGKLDEETLSHILDAFISLDRQAATTDEDEGEEPLTLLEDLVQDECGGRVVCALLNALGAPSCDEKRKLMVLDVVMRLFEENEALHEHYVACKVMSSLVLNGDHEIQRRALHVLCQGAETLDLIQVKLRNRHTAVTIRRLIERFPTETVSWLKDALGLVETSGGGGKKKQGKTNGHKDGKQDVLLYLANDPVASPVMRTFILHCPSRAAVLRGIDVAALLGSKRGCKFLQEILSHDLTELASNEAAEIFNVVLSACEANIVEMCSSGDANFVVQAAISLIPHTGQKEAVTNFKHLLQLLGPQLSSLVDHPISVHVVVCVVVTANSLPNKAIVEEVAAMLVKRSNVGDLLSDARGSLVVRKLLPLCKVKESKVGELLVSAIERDITALMYDSIGNVMVQEYIKVFGAEKIARSLIKADELLRMCQHVYASHVVVCLFDHVGASTHTALCNALRAHVVTLTRHNNGRFVVEKAIPASRDICDVLLRNFVSLACEKGSQHVLCTLMASLDQQGKGRVVELVLSGLAQMATQQSSSIVLQKLLQMDDLLLQKVREKLKQDPRLRNNLAQNFYGKFVVQISEST
ncbi:pumilio-repeat, RNA-binding protein, putative [Trypanosoma brucei gambiense DAL972]|uniref:Pumilio-repeat, RNA-binding protein, putative n=1 Tax=Trypanosoma brucei gambiense (strain MHOM/CI/86/DAL972) TaxID=679716 RepID=D0A7J7_TRYB9|nr:pumilio-repeat, RNA-binding protein, putative [Trypanosoma brucei gambiense DAL972]CBH17648.1 pumilio-repeat, RNA-binding protein, putative [Trypanosoma brucei gambiense DAL972]|eukprot:XP_011779912.1 pumilio-repeat, RNA-binding protein, putative [Trypanosoma brucei gambiense DAL972]